MRWNAMVVAAAISAGACGPSVAIDDGDTEAGSDGDSTTSNVIPASGTTAASPTTMGADTTGDGTFPSDGGTDPDTSPTTTSPITTSGPGPDTDPGTSTSDGGESSDGTNPGGAPDGSSCSVDAECFSNHCFSSPVLGGICGECNDEGDCPLGGCSLPNPLTGMPAQCNDGSIGGGCNTDAACGGDLVCAQILAVPGVLTASTCSECVTDADCAGQLCVPTYDVAGISGLKTCEPAGSVANGLGCDLGPTGDASCQSGLCSSASLMGLLNLGVCSECESDGDCVAPGAVCSPAEVDLAAGLVPGTCI